MDATAVAVDFAKSVFELAVADSGGQVVDQRRVRGLALHLVYATSGPAAISARQ
jgi:hypothetical protein